MIASKKTHGLSIEHSFENKITGFFLFLLPLSVCVVDIKFGATFVCIVATITAIKEIVNRKEAFASIIKKSSRYV